MTGELQADDPGQRIGAKRAQDAELVPVMLPREGGGRFVNGLFALPQRFVVGRELPTPFLANGGRIDGAADGFNGYLVGADAEAWALLALILPVDPQDVELPGERLFA
jgi:hypothetical protein